MELLWGLFAFGCAWAKNVETIYALRFFVGAAETVSFTGVIYVVGSWYKPKEIARRVALFFTASPLGTMFAGYLQAAAYRNLNGTYGVEVVVYHLHSHHPPSLFFVSPLPLISIQKLCAC